MQRSIILNEREYAEKCLELNSLGYIPYETLTIISRYYSDLGFNQQEIEKQLEYFLIKSVPNINVTKWQNLIDNRAKNAHKHHLVEIDKIIITKHEMSLISKLEKDTLKRLMFTLLCVAKYGNAKNKNNNSWTNREDKEIFRLANITTSLKQQSLLINQLKNIGYIKYCKVIDNLNLNVQIVDNNTSEKDIALAITDFRNLGYQCMNYYNNRYTHCKNCGLIIPKKSNRQKYCVECAVEINREKSCDRKRRGS